VYCYGANLGWDARAALAPMGEKALTFDDFEAMIEAIVQESRPGDHVLVMSNGGFGGIHGKLLQALKEKGAA
jgi:UDP-N-acetylmuramate: L-alanyl-gamma-D-glutamyl-meso-diaminopimelate ligase